MRRRGLALLFAAASGLSGPVSAQTASPEEAGGPLDAIPIQLQGNAVLISEVYLSVLHYAGWETAPEDPVARGQWIERTLEDFLHASGYQLASVVVLPEGDGYEVLIDEGRLDKIIFRNVDPWTTVQLLFLLDLPAKVFNRDLLERRLRRVKEKMSVARVEYEVVPVDEPDHQRLQLKDPKIIEGLTLLAPGEPHELRIAFESEDRRAGLSLGIGFQPPDGLLVQGSYLAPGVLVRSDRLETSFRLGVRVTDISRIPGNRVGLSRAGGGVVWSTPSLFELLRFNARVQADIEARRREDLAVINYFFAPVQLALGFAFEQPFFRIGAEGGVEQRSFFDARDEDGARTLSTLTELRSFAGADLRLTFNPDRLRRDRPHEVSLRGRYLWPVVSAEGDIRELRLRYRNTVGVGFDELRYELRGAWLDGNVPFFSELSMGDGFLRSAFQGTVFSRRLAAAKLEYRFSLSRDELKLGLFNDVVVYEAFREIDALPPDLALDDLESLRPSEGLQVIDNFGVGLHILLLDAFQVDAYFGAGVRLDGQVDIGISLDVKQAF